MQKKPNTAKKYKFISEKKPDQVYKGKGLLPAYTVELLRDCAELYCKGAALKIESSKNLSQLGDSAGRAFVGRFVLTGDKHHEAFDGNACIFRNYYRSLRNAYRYCRS